MHRLLKKQIRDAKASDGSFDAARLLELVSNAYAKSDDRRMKVREARSASPQDGDCGICPAETGAAICDLKNAIENVNQGIAMIDAKGRILVINARYRELTGLSRDDIKASPTLSSILKLLEKRGEFASMDPDFTDWLKKGQTRAEHPFSYRRTRPDGTVLQVQVTPLPDG
ncbi:MAG TPA: PAS-domain containing protein, partial [Rhabdaerophilum sp.]|nr:PAS-domain containing protein [Rhabdaerophilum sp.]